MSNPLFASHMMQMAYLCKKQPPAELLGCWPLNVDYRDLSRYGNSITGPSANIYTTSSMAAPFNTCFGYSESESVSYTNLSLPLSKELSLGDEWSVDWYGYYHNVSGFRVILGNFNLSFGNAWGQSSTYPKGINYNGTNIISFSAPAGTYTHFALSYTGTVIKFYTNGSLAQTASVTLAGTVGSVILNADNSSYNGSHVSNFRCVQKDMGGAAYYPVPSDLYTGYETL